MRESTERTEVYQKQTATGIGSIAADTLPKKNFIVGCIGVVAAIIFGVFGIPAALKEWPAVFEHKAVDSSNSLSAMASPNAHVLNLKPTYSVADIGHRGVPTLDAYQLHRLRLAVSNSPAETRGRLRFVIMKFGIDRASRPYIFDPGLNTSLRAGTASLSKKTYKIIGEPRCDLLYDPHTATIIMVSKCQP